MPMSRKDYVLIAGALRDARIHSVVDEASQDVNAVIDRAVLAIAHVLARENPAFKRDYFLAAARGEKVAGFKK